MTLAISPLRFYAPLASWMERGRAGYNAPCALPLRAFRRCGCCFQCANEFTDRRSRIALSRAVFDDLHNGAADNGGIGKFARLLKMLSRGNPEAHCDGQLGEAAQPRDQRLGVAGELLLSAGYAGARHGIDESTR